MAEESMKHPLGVVAIAATLAACTPREPVPITPPSESKGAAVVRRPLPETAPATPSVASAAPSSSAREPAIVVPPGVLYVCVSDAAGKRTQTAIEFSAKVGAMCAKHPEMGPCQYERDICRKSGGRVFASGGVEITAQTEAEYDKKVMRVRFKSN
jgi:hypothetical protein